MAGKTIEERFLVPTGYDRINVDSNSFGAYLRKLPLKPHGTFARQYNGVPKPYEPVYDAVVDLPIGDKDLHQCADAVIRLRAEYLWYRGDYENIHFNFTNGQQVDYLEWMKGRRIKVDNNRTWWVDSAEPDNTYENFWDYLEQVFQFAGTYSLSKELKPKNFEDIQIGNVFVFPADIRKRKPGHAVIVVDLAISQTGERLFLLAQSYMPAQEIHILKNPNDSTLSPWYSNQWENPWKTDLNEEDELFTPEWSFKVTDLKSF